MIVRDAFSPVLLITQPDHAAVAAVIMRAWRAGGLQDSPRRAAIMLAIEQHDNGWREVDASLVLGADGRVLDFVQVPDDVRQGVWQRGVERLDGEPYTAALVAQHALHIYRRMRQQPGWGDFFAELTEARDRQLRLSHEPIETLHREYAFLRLADLASLTFCGVDTGGQASEMGYELRLDAVSTRELRLIVTPDPFGGAVVPLEISGRELTGTVFRDAAAAREAWASAPIRRLTGIAQGV
jgi:hypothetical protein